MSVVDGARRSMADEQPDHLSQLPDELLQRTLQLAPCTEAESTAVLSRRWRGLWPPPTSAVKFDIPSVDRDRFHCRRRDASLRGAKEALAAARGPVKRLYIHVGKGCGFVDFVVGDVLSYRASRDVQDVRISADNSSRNSCYDDDDSWSLLADSHVGEFEFSFGSMASAAVRLRVLHITNCRDLAPPPRGSTFPCLEVLRLRKCIVRLQSLQGMVIASPQLATLQLEYVFLSTVVLSSPTLVRQENEYYSHSDGYYYNCSDDYSRRPSDFPQSLCCPGVTTLVLVNCCCEHEYVAIELDVPRVQHFKYRGEISQFTLRSPLPDVRRAFLHILACYPDVTCEDFWNFRKNFSDAKVLKLKLVWPIDYVAALERKGMKELLGETLFDVEHLEIDAQHNPASENAAVAIRNLLQCCPVILDLRLKLNTAHHFRRRTKISLSTFLKNKAQSEFQKAWSEFHQSVDHFRRRRDRPVIPLCGDR